MLLTGIIFIILAIVIIVSSNEYGDSITAFIFFLCFLFFGIMFVALDIKAPKTEYELVRLVKTNEIPIDYKNPNNITITVNSIENGFIYSKETVILKEYSIVSKHSFIMSCDKEYIVEKENG